MRVVSVRYDGSCGSEARGCVGVASVHLRLSSASSLMADSSYSFSNVLIPGVVQRRDPERIESRLVIVTGMTRSPFFVRSSPEFLRLLFVVYYTFCLTRQSGTFHFFFSLCLKAVTPGTLSGHVPPAGSQVFEHTDRCVCCYRNTMHRSFFASIAKDPFRKS